MRVSVPCFDQVLGKRESHTPQVFNFAILCIEAFRGTQFCPNSQKYRNSITEKFNTFKGS